MSGFSQSEEQIIIKSNMIFMWISIFVICGALAGIWLVFKLLPVEATYTLEHVCDLFFCLCFFMLLMSVGIFAFISNSKQIIINSEGVLCKSCVNKKFIKWTDVKDWGLSYCGKTRWEGNTYYLYFSKHECVAKNERRKKLKGEMIRIFIIGERRSKVINEVFPFCKEKTRIRPFEGK